MVSCHTQSLTAVDREREREGERLWTGSGVFMATSDKIATVGQKETHYYIHMY